jgi:hypothetical protein
MVVMHPGPRWGRLSSGARAHMVDGGGGAETTSQIYAGPSSTHSRTTYPLSQLPQGCHIESTTHMLEY